MPTELFLESATDEVRRRPWLVERRARFIDGIEVALGTASMHEYVQEFAVEQQLSEVPNLLTHYMVTRDLTRHEEGRTLLQMINEDPKYEEKKAEMLKERLAGFENSKVFGRFLLYIRQSALVRAWAAFEAAAEDVWVTALNEGGPRLLKGAFGKPEKGPVRNLYQEKLSFECLLDSGFSLQGRLGTLFAEHQKFTSVEGIQRAYKAAFGWTRKPPTLVHKDVLVRIETMRHVIVHNGGIIDREVLGTIGAPLHLSDADVTNAIGVVCDAGASLLSSVGTLLEEVDPVEKHAE